MSISNLDTRQVIQLLAATHTLRPVIADLANGADVERGPMTHDDLEFAGYVLACLQDRLSLSLARQMD